MRVVVRVRPEKCGNTDCRSSVKILDSTELIFDPKEEIEEFYFHGQVSGHRNMLRRQNRDARFTFDCIFGGDSTNEQIYEQTSKAILDGFLDGYNCCVFAYGATGSGKTHTMLGTQENPGITVLTMTDLYRRIEEKKEEMTTELAVTYLEIYNETIRDLLTPSEALQLREDNQRGVIIPKLSFHKPGSAQELLSMLNNGNKCRTQHPTDANSESSRSHAVFTVHMKQRAKSKLATQMRIAKLSLIDLAGSERAAVVNHRGARLREGANINKSLLALGNCINALAAQKTGTQHVPYRDSKLTRLLKGSLGGNCCTVMIAAVSPSLTSLEDTYNTLKYAARAKAIKTVSKQNIVSMDSHDRVYKEDLEIALRELAEAKEMIKKLKEEKGAADENTRPAVILDNEFSPSFVAIYKERQTLLISHTEIVWRHLDLDMKAKKKTVTLEHISQVAGDCHLGKSVVKADRAAIRMKKKQETLLSEKASLEKRILANNDQLAELQNSVRRRYPTNLPQNVADMMELHELKLQLELSQIHNKHAKQEANDCLREENRYKNLMIGTLLLAKNYQACLKRNNINEEDLAEELNTLLKRLESLKEVSWATYSPSPESRKRKKSRSPNAGIHLLPRKLKTENDGDADSTELTLDTTITLSSPLLVHEICQADSANAEVPESTQQFKSSLDIGKIRPPLKAKQMNTSLKDKLPATPQNGKPSFASTSLQKIRNKLGFNEKPQNSGMRKMGISAKKLVEERNFAMNRNVNGSLKMRSSKSSADIRQMAHPYIRGKQFTQSSKSRQLSQLNENINPDAKNAMKRFHSKSTTNLQT